VVVTLIVFTIQNGVTSALNRARKSSKGFWVRSAVSRKEATTASPRLFQSFKDAAELTSACSPKTTKKVTVRSRRISDKTLASILSLPPPVCDCANPAEKRADSSADAITKLSFLPRMPVFSSYGSLVQIRPTCAVQSRDQ